MFGFRRALVLLTFTTSLLVSAAPHHNEDSIVDWDRLSAILDTIDDSVLHNVLHNLSPKFRDGIFSKNRAAIEHVHSDNPVIASKLVYIAKRQTNSTTTTSTDETTSTTTTVDSSISSALESQITATTVPDPTTVLVAPTVASNEVPIETISGAVVVSTQGGGIVTRTSSAVGVSFTRSTSTHLFYSTASDGTITTSTSLVVVNAPVTETAAATGAAGAAATSGDPGLQNAGTRTSPESMVLSVIGATFAGIVGLFVTL